MKHRRSRRKNPIDSGTLLKVGAVVGVGVVAYMWWNSSTANAAANTPPQIVAANQSGLVLAPGRSQPFSVATGTSVIVDLPVGASWVSWTTPGGVTTQLSGNSPMSTTINVTGLITIVYTDATGTQRTAVLDYTAT